jgi:glycine betaine transporter
MKNLRAGVFWPPVALVFLALALNFWDGKAFIALVSKLNDSILSTFSTTFAVTALVVLLVCVLAFLSPLGRLRLGGNDAKPTLSFWSWVAIVLCTNTGAGILFWAMAEPMFHLSSPPVSLGVAPNSWEAAQFAMSTLFLHWSFTPAALFALPGLTFALTFFNMKLAYSLSSCLRPLLGKRLSEKLATPVDMLALYTLILGMGASLDTGVLSIAGGLEHLYGIKSSPTSWVVIGSVIVLAFLISALSGIEKGIKHLSQLNSLFFLFLALFILVFGAPKFLGAFGLESLSTYITGFWDQSLFLKFSSSDPWPRQWTVFYWAVWMAWAPITAGFLGRIGYGYTVRQFLVVNLVVPSVFAIVWMSIFAGTALHLELFQGADLTGLLVTRGPESLAYAVFSRFPGASVIIPLFLVLVFISYVTAADSNTLVMASMSSKNITRENPDPGPWLKIFWGILVGSLALLMLTLSGVEGIKTLSYIGGLPALFFLIGSTGSLILMCLAPSRYGLFNEEPEALKTDFLPEANPA